jgi:iron-sulfur cluster assembly protein
MITVTETAAKEILKILEQHRQGQAAGAEPKELYLRAAVAGGGCSGFKQTLEITETVGENDEVFEQHGVKVICDPKSHIYLDGSIIDYKTTVMSSGFVFDIPTATGRCGCGASFSA